VFRGSTRRPTRGKALNNPGGFESTYLFGPAGGQSCPFPSLRPAKNLPSSPSLHDLAAPFLRNDPQFAGPSAAGVCRPPMARATVSAQVESKASVAGVTSELNEEES